MLATRHIVYDQLKELMTIIERVLPDDPHVHACTAFHSKRGVFQSPVVFSPGKDSVIEAKPEGVWQLNIDPRHWMFEGGIPDRYSSTSVKRWYIRRITQHRGGWNDHVLNGPDVPLPSGVRMWHATEDARKMLLLARQDLMELFRAHAAEDYPLPHDTEGGVHSCGGGTVSVLVTPSRVLGFSDGICLLQGRSPYLARLCLEYARTTCWVYGLSLQEFYSLAQMSISRHVGGSPITLQKHTGGVYNNGPVLTIMIGHTHVSHDFSPILMQNVRPSGHRLTPVRMKVSEGVMVVMDGYTRACYGHGYTLEPTTEKTCSQFYFTIDITMDSMRETRLLGYIKETGEMIMHTPVVQQHVVQIQGQDSMQHAGSAFTPPAQANTVLYGACPVLDLIRVMRTRLRSVESNLLSSKSKESCSPPEEDYFEQSDHPLVGLHEK
jgi:hypothetical protein